MGHTLSGSNADHFSDHSCEPIFSEFSYFDRYQAFIDYLDELDGPDSLDDLAEWSYDIDLFLESLSNPDKIKEFWERSKAKELWDKSQIKIANCTSRMPSPRLHRLDRHPINMSRPDDSVSIEDYLTR